MSIRYEIEENTNAIRVFYDDNDYPSLYQPDWPSGEPWADFKEAEDWAKMYIEAVINDSSPYPPSARGEEPIQK